MVTATKHDPPRLFPPSPACSPLPNFEFRVSNFAFLPLSPFPATLTRNQRFCRKTASVSPLFATLTDTPSRKSFPCHSCENMGGVPPLVPASASRRPRNPLTPLESALTDSSSRKSFRIRSYEKHGGRGYIPASQTSFPPAPGPVGELRGAARNYLLPFHTLPHCFAQRRAAKPFVFCRFRTVFITTEGGGLRFRSPSLAISHSPLTTSSNGAIFSMI